MENEGFSDDPDTGCSKRPYGALIPPSGGVIKGLLMKVKK
jgi:hypothetical protein